MAKSPFGERRVIRRSQTLMIALTVHISFRGVITNTAIRLYFFSSILECFRRFREGSLQILHNIDLMNLINIQLMYTL